MLSDDAIDNLIQPIIDRQENINLYVITQIAKRLKEIGKLSPSDLYTLNQLYETGSDVRRINAELSRLSGLQEKNIKSLIKTVALDSYMDMKPFFDYRHKSFIPYKENTTLQRFVNAIVEQTAGTYTNLSRTTAFMIRDPHNRQILRPTSISETYQTVVDEALQSVQLGITDYQSAMRRTMKQLVDSGIRTVKYDTESGRPYTRRLDTSVRQNLLEGVRAVSQKVQDETGKEFGSDGKELSAHPFSAPDHEPFQGLQFTNEQFDRIQANQDFYDTTGEHFEAVKRIIGQYNCRHVAWSIIIGFSPPNYSKAQLQKWREQNKKGITLPNGKHLSMYECTQEQRRLETEIRRAKEGKAIAKAAGDDELVKQYQAQVTQKRKEYNEFSKTCGLSTKPDRLVI